jgi:hypothetical protein
VQDEISMSEKVINKLINIHNQQGCYQDTDGKNFEQRSFFPKDLKWDTLGQIELVN